jgi:hypothetical protein
MSSRRSKGAVLVGLDALQFPATVAYADDLLADGDGRAPIGSSVLGLGRVGGWTSRAKPVAIAVTGSNHPGDDASILVGGPTFPFTTTSTPVLTGGPLLASLGPVTSIPAPAIPSSNDKVVPRGRTVPLRFRLAGDEPSGLDTAGWQIVPLQVDCADRDSMIASSLDLRDQAPDAGRPDRPQQADRPARGSRGSQDRGTKGGRSER